jgi:hypothetical protein
MLKSAKEVVATGNLTEVVDFAIEVNREITSATKELEVAKAALRDEGSKKAALGGETNISLDGTLGSAQVVFPKEAPKVKKGRAIAELLAALPAEVFGSLFAVEYKIDPEFASKLAGLTAAQRAAVANIVELTTATPRVNLPK